MRVVVHCSGNDLCHSDAYFSLPDMCREGLLMECATFINNPDGTPLYENTFQYAILKKEWDAQK
jgi:hypothetical protein